VKDWQLLFRIIGKIVRNIRKHIQSKAVCRIWNIQFT